jgi:serine/threonine protein kinase
MGFEERRIGTVIGKWRVDSLLGSGSMAAVYAVTHRNGSRAALKILHGQLCNDDAVVERFLSEGYLANVVKHPGIVRVFDDGMTDEGCPFLAMEMLEGETLEDYCEHVGPRLDLETVVNIADSIMDALAAVHAGGVIHRDLKPSNVFLTADQQIKLLDFGVAKLSDKKAMSKLSLVGMVLGTPAYMAPEQALGAREAVDARSDIFGLGAMIFTMLTGENVHPVEGTQQKLLAAATAKARSLATVLPDLPAGIIAVVDQALQFKKDDRWQTVTQMRNALKEATELARSRSLWPPPPSTARVSDYVKGQPQLEQNFGNGSLPDFDDAATQMMTVDVPKAPPAPLAKTLMGITAADLPGALPNANPYGLPVPMGAPPATMSGQYLAIPQPSDSGRVGFFYDKQHPSSSALPAAVPSGHQGAPYASQGAPFPHPGALSPHDSGGVPAQYGYGQAPHESGRHASQNGSYPSGAETSLDASQSRARKSRWPLFVGVAAVVAVLAGAGVYIQASKRDAGGRPPTVPTSMPSALPSVPVLLPLPSGSARAIPTTDMEIGIDPVPPPSTTAAPSVTAKPTAWVAPTAKGTSTATANPAPTAKPAVPKGDSPPDLEILQ